VVRAFHEIAVAELPRDHLRACERRRFVGKRSIHALDRSVVGCNPRDKIRELLGKRRVCSEQLGRELVALG